ncbi:MAG: hypothetical protein IIU12_04155 [Prevotella sp.]|nr:hypothetical protein [Prevotella sp.]
MAFSSKLQFGDKNSDHVYNVADCHLHFMRHYNHFRPDTDARCEKVEVVVEAPGKNDLRLQEWFINNEPQNGRVIFDIPSKTAETSSEKTVEFEGAYCYSLEEVYHINIQRRRFFRLAIVADKITVNQTEFKNLYASTAF